MKLPLDAIPVPLHYCEGGEAMRVIGTRIPIDTIVIQFQSGASAESIMESYPTLALADIYLVIAYYLRNKVAVDDYIRQRQEEGERLRQQITSNEDYKLWRDRLMARKARIRICLNGRESTVAFC